MSKKLVNVAIALLFNKKKVLVGWRHAGQHQGEKAEFPGGKVEAGESAVQACIREVYEEVGIQLNSLNLFDVIEHEYDDLIVKLHIFQGNANSEQIEFIKKPWQWYTRAQLKQLNFPKANDAIIERLDWVNIISIQNFEDSNIISSLSDVVYIRTDRIESLAQALNLHAEQNTEQFIVNQDVWSNLSDITKKLIYAVQFKHAQLFEIDANSFADQWKGIKKIASCHDLESLHKACDLGFDAVFLSPVLVSQSHPEHNGIGWEALSQMIQDIHIPVFALGGMSPNQLETAQKFGAYGVAGIQNFKKNKH